MRPRGIGKAVCRIIGKAAVSAFREDIRDAAGPLQVSTGHLSGCEAVVHAMHKILDTPGAGAVLLVDVSNTSNSSVGKALFKMYVIYDHLSPIS